MLFYLLSAVFLLQQLMCVAHSSAEYGVQFVVGSTKTADVGTMLLWVDAQLVDDGDTNGLEVAEC